MQMKERETEEEERESRSRRSLCFCAGCVSNKRDGTKDRTVPSQPPDGDIQEDFLLMYTF